MTGDAQSLKPILDLDEEGAYAFTVQEADIGARIDKWLSARLPTISRSRLKALIEEGALIRDGAPLTDPSWKMREGERYALTPPPIAEPEPKPEAIPLNIVYEDNDIVIINKPPGLVVHPGAGNWTGTMVNALLHHCGDSLSGIGGVARPGIVHRIDKDTSGLLVVAKNDAAHQGLSAAFSVHDIDRVYQAVAVGAPRPGFGTVNAALARSTTDRKKMAIYTQAQHTGARHAITHYKVMESFGRTRAKLKGDAIASLIQCTLETGRTHQIRAHMASIGHPLVGDQTYGRGPGLSGLRPGDVAADHALSVLAKFRRQALHAKVLGFAHPITGEAMRFECDAPDDLQTLLSALRAL